MMRVAYVCCDPGVPVFGSKGCSIHVQEVIRELLRRGYSIDLIAPRAGGTPTADLSSVRYHPVPVGKSSNPNEREQIQTEANTNVLQLLAELGPFDLVYERYSLYAYAGMQYAKATGTPGVLEVNSPLIREQAEYRQLENRETAEEMTWQTMTNASAVIAVSEPVADYVKAYRNNQNSVHVIPNGVDVNRFANCLVQRKQNEDEPLTIGFVGTLKQWHGVADLIEAYQQVATTRTNTRLLIVGNGPERARLELQVANLPNGLDQHVHFTGAVAADQIPAQLSQMDVAVAPYGSLTDFYFSPLKIYEYMAAGLPTVVSRVGQIPELIKDDVTGLLYCAGNTSELARALVTLIEQPELRTRLGLAARRQVSANSTWDAVVSQILSIASQDSELGAQIPEPHFNLAGKQTLKNLATKP